MSVENELNVTFQGGCFIVGSDSDITWKIIATLFPQQRNYTPESLAAGR